MTTYQNKNLPPYLKKYLIEQDYEAYTPQEHATWRYIMRQSREFFKVHATDVYLEGLKRTGVPIDHIPRISDMDDKLSEFGWGAVGICGFIPSSVFLDLLARKLMPIATDIRTVDHIGYTPAPDIVHEAAGHAPIVADPAYRTFLESYAQLAYRALISSEDIQLYEAIRLLSDIKENPDAKPHEIVHAEKRLKLAGEAMSYVSEAGKLARLAWWTIEYGLVGSLTSAKIYGAGLLSSITESRQCLSSSVKKIPLTVDCVNQSYDITEPQPQLFVTPSLDDLPSLLDELENSFSYKIGGIFGLEAMKKAQTLNSVQLESGLSVSGKLEDYRILDDKAIFIKFSLPSQICFNETELPGQGVEQHPHGFSSPIGRWKKVSNKSPSNLTAKDLGNIGIRKGEKASLEFCSGFVVEGTIKNILFKNNKLLLVTWVDCRAHLGQECFFEPEWGDFDMLVGEEITSVFAGPADREAYGDYGVGQASTTPGRQTPYSSLEKRIFEHYAKVRQIRQGASSHGNSHDLEELAEEITNTKEKPWLLGLEVIEVAKQKFSLDPQNTPWLKQMADRLAEGQSKETCQLLEQGLKLIEVKD